MRELEDFLGFPARIDREKGTVEFESNCEFPNQSHECKKLFESIERLFINEVNLKFPLNIKEWKAIIEPTDENISTYYSHDGIKHYMQQHKNKLIDTITFFKPEVFYGRNKELPSLILHFYQVNYTGKLNIYNSYGFVNKCHIKYKDIKQLTPDRIESLKQKGINVNWIRNIPLFPAEKIEFDEQDIIMDFKFQELNKSNFNDEI
ncbi:hypothetical protein [Flavobacterium sp.]|jgi:hypothetical protein|uniref:hypothetical protein n=1 Tax=Flavobacterium sp. TaxID=239 RepID=UPI0037BEC5CC